MKRLFLLLLALVIGLLSIVTTAFADKSVSIWIKDVIPFGQYPQTVRGNDMTPIEWIVEEIQDGKAMLVSKYGLDCQPYHKSKKNITWEKCSLRAWLNKDFLKKAFTKEEQAVILTTEVDNGKNQNTTKDQVYLLSRREAEAYFHVGSSQSHSYVASASVVAPTAYAISKRNAYTDSFYKMQEEGQVAGWWWLRTSGSNQQNALTIQPDGKIHEDSVNFKTLVVRPVIWVDLNNDLFSEYIYDSDEISLPESYQRWLDEGAGSHLPRFQLQSGEEPEIDIFVNDDEEFDVRIYNASDEDYRAYIELWKSYGYKILNETDEAIDAITLEGYEVFANNFTSTWEDFVEIFIIAPNGI